MPLKNNFFYWARLYQVTPLCVMTSRKPPWIEYQLKKSIYVASACGFRIAGIVKVIWMK